jgi:replicative DNA helicase
MSSERVRVFTPPNNILKEESKKQEPQFISILLKDADCLSDCFSSGFGCDEYGRSHFLIDNCAKIFDAIQWNFEKYSTILSKNSINEYFKVNNVDTEDKVIVTRVFEHCLSLDVPSADYAVLKNSIHGKYIQCLAIHLLRDKIEDLTNAQTGQDERVKELQEVLLSLDNASPDSYVKSFTMAEANELAMKNIESRRDNPEKFSGIMTGMKGLDDLLYGFEPGSYAVIAGMVNGGKTTLMLNVAYKIAKNGYNVVYITIEKDAVPIAQRIICLNGLIDFNRIRRGGKGEGGLNEFWINRIRESRDEIDNKINPQLTIVQATHGVSLSNLLAQVEKVRKKSKVDVVVLDYLGVVGHENLYPNRPDLNLGMTSLRFQGYGKRHKIACVTGVQITNEGTKELKKIMAKNKDKPENKEAVIPGTEVLGGSQKVIADADTGISIILNDDNPPTKATIGILKGRDVARGTSAEMDFDGNTGSISDPIYLPGQIVAVDQLLYSEELDIDEIKSAEALFEKLTALNEPQGNKPVQVSSKRVEPIVSPTSSVKVEVSTQDISGIFDE